jgi:hypothetical protein
MAHKNVAPTFHEADMGLVMVIARIEVLVITH